MPNVSMPNGDVVFFPDDMPKEQIRGLIQQKFPEVSAQQAPQEKTILGALGENLSQRGSKIVDVFERNKQGTLDPLSSTYITMGSIGSGVGDVVGAGTQIADYALGGYPSAALSSVGNTVGKLPSFGGGTLADALPNELARGAKAYDQFAQKNPYAAEMIGATGGLMQILPASPTLSKPITGLVGKVAGAADEVGGRIVNKAMGQTVKVPKTAKEFRAIKDVLYSNAEKAGGAIPAKHFDEFLNRARRAVGDTEDIVKNWKGSEDSVISALNRIEENRGQNLGFSGYMKQLQTLNDEIDSEYDVLKKRLSPKGRKLLIVKKELQSALDKSMEDGSFIGGKVGAEAFKKANRFNRSYEKISALERTLDKAENYDAYDRKVRTEVRKLYERGVLDGDNKKSVKKAMSAGLGIGTLDITGSGFAPVVGTALGGVAGAGGGGVAVGTGAALGAAGASAVKAGSRSLAGVLQKNRVKSLMSDIIRATDPSYDPRLSTKVKSGLERLMTTEDISAPVPQSPLLALPAPDAARPMTDSQIYAAKKKMRETQKMGGTSGLYDYGDVPYNTIIPEAPQRQRLLPAPTPDTVVTPSGTVKNISVNETIANREARKRAESLGLTMDVRRTNARNEIRRKNSALFDSYSKEKQERILSEIEAMHNQTRLPVEEIVKNALKNAQALEAESGVKQGNFADFLQDAFEKQKRSK